MMESLKKELDKITVNTPLADFKKNVKNDDLPESYTTNSDKEALILSYCENFHRQFVHLYRDRKPLLLAPPNESGVEKFISTTIRPTELPYKELYDYDACAEFVADYLNFETLDPPIDLPAKIPSPTTVLKRQKGNCFDYSIVLCSLLIGAGYDAYCVSGYADKETTLMDQTRQACSMIKEKSDTNPDKEALTPRGRSLQQKSKGLAFITKGRKDLPGGKRLYILAAISHSLGVVLVEEYTHMNAEFFAKLIQQTLAKKLIEIAQLKGKTKLTVENISVRMAVCDETSENEKKKEERKYTVKPPKDLQSKFELKMVAKLKDEEDDVEKKRLAEQRAKIQELEKPPVDKLHGLRVHCWVLVLSGKREVPESFFIESLTGHPKACNDNCYLGIESLWNNTNLWVNMQDCSQGTKNLFYDLGDPTKWEYMFPNTDKPLLAIPNVNDDILEMDDDEDEEGEVQFDLPPSWVNKIEISPKEFQTRCPFGKKTVIYKKAKLDKFAGYLNRDGLITRLSVYSDNELKDLVEVREYYKNRVDKLDSRIHKTASGQIVENFLPGRQRSLREHSYKASSSGPESDRIMHFYSNARVDGLVKREETSTSMTEYFEGREDFLCYRHVMFGKRVKKFGPQTAASRPIVKMIERFRRDYSKPANENVAERQFAVSEDRILLQYHLEDQRVTSSTREFIKPPNYSSDKGTPLQLTADTTNAFQVDPYASEPKELDIYNMLVYLLEAEKQCTDKIRESEEEVREILDDRMKEESVSKLSVSIYDTERNEKAKLRRIELEKKQREEEMRKRDMELDYLAPFLARIGDPKRLERQDAYKIKEECLQDLKQRLIDKANLIQARFERETQELQKKQAMYQQNQMSMTKEDEEDYLNFCSEAMFRIHILELRLSRHKEMAPHKYMQLDEKLQKDPRLSDLLL